MATTTVVRPREREAVPLGARARTARRWAPVVAALAGWLGLVWIAHRWGEELLRRGHRLQVDWPPLVGEFDPRFGATALPAIALGAAAVVFFPALTARLSWRRLLIVTALAAAGWAVALALVDGPRGLTSPLMLRGEYLHDVPRVGSPGAFLASFTERLPSYHTHVQGHPPGMVLLLWALSRLGLGGARWTAALCIGGGAVGAAATLVALRAVVGEARARVAAPFLALAPAAVWVATTADAFYAGLGAVGVALVALACRATGSPGRGGDALAGTGGLLLGAAVFCSYGAVLLAPVVAAVVVSAGPPGRRLRLLLVAAAGAGAVAVAFAAFGFWWFDGLSATRTAYAAGVASRRPYDYFLVANLAAFAIAVGPAAVAGLARLRQKGPWLMAGGALVAVALADLSGLSKGEVERIWLPFVPWVLVATCALAGRHHTAQPARSWLGLQVAVALGVQLVVRTPW